MMLPRKDHVASFLLLWVFITIVKCYDIEEMLKTIDDTIIGIGLEQSGSEESNSLIWQEYEFGTGAGNREEIVITDIAMHRYMELSESTGWQYVQAEKNYLVSAEGSKLSFFKVDIDNSSIEHEISLFIDGPLLSFKAFNLDINDEKDVDCTSTLMVVVLVESEHDSCLFWYRMCGSLKLYSKLRVKKEIMDLELVQEGNQYRLLLLSNDTYNEAGSLVDIYSFTVDYIKHRIDSWFCRRLYIPKTLDMQACPIYNKTVLAFRDTNNIALYESKNDIIPCQFEKFQDIPSSKIRNFVCFESSYVAYLAIAGKEPYLFYFFESEFQNSIETDLQFNDTEIIWVTSVPLNTYREESLLLVQLKNWTVLAFTWQGSKFVQVSLPNRILDNFDLSRIVEIPKLGFIHGNMFVQIETSLRELAHPFHRETETMLKARALLEEVYQRQEYNLDEIQERINKSYLKNPVVTGAWNLSVITVDSATIDKNVTYGAVKVGSLDLKMEDILTNVTSSTEKLKKLEAKLDGILPDFKDMIATNATKITLDPDVEMTADLLVNGTLHVKNVKADSINNVSTWVMTSHPSETTANFVINGIQTDNLTVLSVNGMPLKEIVFHDYIIDYSFVNFTSLRRLVVDGQLNFTEINGMDWKDLLSRIVWKDKPALIPEEAFIEGELTAQKAHVDNLNDFQYPHDYVIAQRLLRNNVVNKTFGTLATTYLRGLKTINDVDINDYIVVIDEEIILNNEVTFENLEINGRFEIDGVITGINIPPIENMLNETNMLLSNVMFENLTVLGNVIVEELIDTKTWPDFDELLSKDDENILITGNKEFLNAVNIMPNVTIESNRINNRPLSEFVTLNTDQEFPNLKKISSNVTFGNVTFGAIKKLEDYIIREQDSSSGWLDKVFMFIKSPLIDNLSFETMKQTISQSDFLDRLNKTLEKVHFENLTLSTLTAAQILPKDINGINYTDFGEGVLTASTWQNVTGSLIIDNLITDVLYAEVINYKTLDEWEPLFAHAKSLYEQIFSGYTVIDSLNVTGMITMSLINGKSATYYANRMETVIFEKNVAIKNLTLFGSMNNLNVTELIEDAVTKTDREVKFTGRKQLKNVTCKFLDARFINDHSAEDLFNPYKEQVLKESLTVHGSVTVLKHFNTTGKIGDIPFANLTDAFTPLRNDFYILRGNFHFTENANIAKLDTNGPIQGLVFDDFLKQAISKTDNNVTISEMKLFKNPVTFNNFFIIKRCLNDLNLHTFYEKAIYINKDFSINSKVTFKSDVHIEKDLTVKKKLQPDSIMGVNWKDLQENTIPLNVNRYFVETITINNATFQGNINNVEQINGIAMDKLIPLHTKQSILNAVNSTNVTVRHLEILGLLNRKSMDMIYADTFTINEDQVIKGNITIFGNVYSQRDFDTGYINNINSKQVVFLHTNDIISGSLIFKDPVVLNGSLRILGLLDGMRSIDWEGSMIKLTSPMKQIVTGNWRIHGNVHFKKNVDGSELLNQFKITDIIKEHGEIDNISKNANETLNKKCTNLNVFMCKAANQIYKFNMFDYLKILEFEGDIHDIRYVELDEADYLLVNYDTCRVKLLRYTSSNFIVLDELSDFGLIDQWAFFKFNRAVYIITSAHSAHTCGKSVNNIWKLENNTLTHVLKLGNAINIAQVKNNEEMFVAMVHDNLKTAPETIRLNILKAIVPYEKLSSILKSNSIVSRKHLDYKLPKASPNNTYLQNCATYNSQLTFKTGVYEKEEYIYYDERTNQDCIYLCRNGASQTEILQTIISRRPKSFLVLNFDEFVETLLIFIENNETIQIYEYRGIEGFVSRNAIKMKVDRLHHLKIRKHASFEKKHCLAAINGNRLTLLEAKMYGEKMDLKTLSTDVCEITTCTESSQKYLEIST